MTYAEEIRKEFCWSIRTQRLISAALIKQAEETTPYAAEILKATSADKKAEALELIKAAREHCEKKIAADLRRGRITKAKAASGKRAIDLIENEAKAAAEALK